MASDVAAGPAIAGEDADSDWHDEPGNTPVVDVPEDYYPPGCGAWFELPHGDDAGKRLFVRDSVHGDGDPEETVVLVHGNPECSYTYRHVVSHLERLADDPFRVVTMDHVGFGLSDRAGYPMLCPDHAENLHQLIEALDLADVTLVVHDWGGPIGVGAFLREPERVSNLVVTNSTVFPIPDDGYTFDNYPMRGLSWPRFPTVVPDRFWPETAAYAVFRTPAKPPELIGGFLWYIAKRQTGWLPDRKTAAHRVYSQQFRDRTNVRGSKLLVRQTPTWGEGQVVERTSGGVLDTRPFYEQIHDRIGAWAPDGQDIGVRAVVGRWDPTAKPSSMARWVDALPQFEGNITAFEGVSHFVEEERPSSVAAAIRDVTSL
jgi:pimeloyl-ACP methyl ester carboxylesterase